MNSLTPFEPARPPDNEQVADSLAWLNRHLRTATPQSVIAAALGRFEDRFAIVSSFGAESAVLLHMAASVSPDIPVLFLETGKLFGETKRYRDQLIDQLSLTDVRSITPDPEDLAREDPKGHLWAKDANRCCFIRKVKPLHKALSGFDAWATGRKRYQGGERSDMALFEAADGRAKINPLAGWTREAVAAYAQNHGLPEHPLVADGFRSIGCLPCTDRVEALEGDRDGRWRGQDKQECGIHKSWAENMELYEDGSGI